MFRLAHLSDPHLAPLPRPRLGQLMSKRLMGYISWQKRRKAIHLAEVLDRLTTDMKAARPDHVAVTGDLVNISLPDEFAAAADWLRRLGPPDRVTVVPGNHDAYVALPFDRSWRLWAAYMSSEMTNDVAGGASHGGPDAGPDSDPGREPTDFGDFPLVRRRGPLAVIGTSSATPTGPGLATGKLGARQLGALERQLGVLGREGRFRVVLIHHPPLDETTHRHKRLLDSGAFLAVLRRAGAELVLHGHDHRFLEARIERDPVPIPVFGVPSASALPYGGRPAAHYFLHEVERGESEWTLTVRARGLHTESDSFAERFCRTIRLERAGGPGRS